MTRIKSESYETNKKTYNIPHHAPRSSAVNKRYDNLPDDASASGRQT